MLGCRQQGSPPNRLRFMRRTKGRRQPEMVVELCSAEVRVGDHLIVSEANLVCGSGEVVAIRGPNGSGKTSMLRTLAGLLRPRLGTHTGPASCAYVPAAFDPPGIAAGRWLRHFPRHHRVDPTRALELLEFRGDLTQGCDALSFGNLRKLVLAEALSSGEPLILIDEAGMGLDAPGIRSLQALIHETADAGVCVVVSGQDSQFMPEFTKMVVLRNQRLALVLPGQLEGELRLRGDIDKLEQVRALAHSLGLVEPPT